MTLPISYWLILLSSIDKPGAGFNVGTEMPLADIKFLPKEYSSPSTLFIFGDYVATLLWSELPFAFVIKSKEIAKSYYNYFNLIWEIANA